MSRSSVSQTSCRARNLTVEIESCGEKCANLCRVYKLIMVSRVPGYGQLEYLVPGLSFESHHHVTLINFVGLFTFLIGIEMLSTISMFNNHHDS